MTNSSLSSALKSAAVLAFAALAGCGANDGSDDYREGYASFVAGEMAAAEESFTDCLKHAPQNVDALLMLTRTELRLGEIPKARAAVAKAEELAGGDPDVLELSAQVAYQEKDFKKARELYSRLAANAEFGTGVQSRGYAGLGVLDYAGMTAGTHEESAARARTAFLTAIRLDFRNASAHYHLGRLYYDIFHYSTVAKAEFELFVGLAPQDEERTKRVKGKLIPEAQARIEADRLQRPGAGKRDSAACAAALDKGAAAKAKGQIKDARQHYATALAADPLSAPAALGLAACAESAREALKYYKIACELSPSMRQALVALGDCAVKAGSPAVAEEAYSRAAAVAPKDAAVLRQYVAALRKNGKVRVADVYQRYLDTLPVKKR